MKTVILDHDQVIQLLPMSECIEVMAEALKVTSAGHAYNPLRSVVHPPEAAGIMGLMPAYWSGERAAFGLKAVCIFRGNPAIGKDAHQGAVLVFSAETGELMAVVNASAITAVRTGAVSGVATRLLARKEASDLAIIGAGVQGRSHLEAMAAVRTLKRVRIADRIYERAQAMAAEMSARFSLPIEAVKDNEAAVRGADIIVTVTNSKEPVVHREWIAPGAHLNIVGASQPDSREVDTATLAAARFYVDLRESTLNESGDYLAAAAEGLVGPAHIQAEIGELLLDRGSGRQSDGDITLFKALGLAVEDLAAAEYVYRRAREKQVGTWLEF